MRSKAFRTALACAITLPLSAGAAQAATMTDLVAGTTLVQGDVTFSNFRFDDFFGADDTGGIADRQNTPFVGDRSVDASDITVTTSSTPSSVSLTATVAPRVSIADGFDPTFDHIYDFFLDFDVTVAAGSSREITGVTLGDGDLFATGNGVSEVIVDIGSITSGVFLEIFEAPGLGLSETSDFVALAATRSVQLFGQVEGNTNAGDTAGLSTYSLTFDLAGTAPPPAPIPVPAALPLLLTGLAAMGLVRRARRA